jgi:hypothetical protein
MLAIGIVLNLVGLGVFCWLLFSAAVYALPSFVGVSAGLFAFHTGAGPLGAVVIALLAGGATLAVARIVFALLRSPIARFVIALLFAAPTAVVGYYAAHGLAMLTTSSEVWQQVFAAIGAIVIGGTAWLRLADAPLPVGTSEPVDPEADHGRSLTTT